MKHDITSDVISDLWPLYRSGEASPDTEWMIEAYLETDAAFRDVLERSERMTAAMPEMTLSSDAELEMIKVARERTRAAVWLIGAGIAAAMLAVLVPVIIAAILYGGRVF